MVSKLGLRIHTVEDQPNASRPQIGSQPRPASDIRVTPRVPSQHPVRTAAMSLAWRIAPEQVGIGFD
jgi:hypothetical protein